MTKYSEFRMRYTGALKVGDVVKRKIITKIDHQIVSKEGEYGIVVDRYMGGSPIMPCVEVMWCKSETTSGLGECYLDKVEEEYDKAG